MKKIQFNEETIELSEKNTKPIRLNRVTLVPRKGKDYAEVLFIGDVHYGSPQCDVKRFKEMLAYALHKHINVLLMGDLIELATRHSIGAGVYEQESVGQTQYEDMVEMLKPLADAKLIIGLHSGNHEGRLYDSCGVDISKALARELQVTYLGDAGWTQLRVGKQKYHVYSLHGRTGAKYDGTVLRAIENISSSFYADVLAHGHAHKKISGEIIVEAVVNDRVVQRKKIILVTGSYVKYDGGYWQKTGGQISKLGSPKVKFFLNEHSCHVSW
jgi:UDP-2,3-diacylglucosamine pyrophosphatase LpxH